MYYNGIWTDIPSMENALIVNGGDYLSLISNNQFISPLHRVINVLIVNLGELREVFLCLFSLSQL